ncbi:Pyrophosphate--fructose 6-phosphate 1-phosphotransferase subunit alpha [Rhynchospora pubera]|uniref:Pyrophosphate--fructose 6-phosphate 1-phosphotransferase subunit alpha n=1 Tax=Rhynchospora pubera TaxID=906938 RepID=A0AAV8FV42_9POAL|nr:Pyrophosphate--fructose 6-phosphate 1-phosphotransferase subunit alpha [Rhynchospora pubera]
MDIKKFCKAEMQKPSLGFQLNIFSKGPFDICTVSMETSPERVGIIVLHAPYPSWKNVVEGIHRATSSWKGLELMIIGSNCDSLNMVEMVSDELLSNLISPCVSGLESGFNIVCNNDLSFLKSKCKELNLDAIILLGGTSNDVIMTSMFRMFDNIKVIWMHNIPKVEKAGMSKAIVDVKEYLFYTHLIKDMCYTALNSDEFSFFLEKRMLEEDSHIDLRFAIEVAPGTVLEVDEVLKKRWNIDDAAHKVCDLIKEHQLRGTEDKLVVFPPGFLKTVPEIYGLLQQVEVLYKSGVKKEKIVSLLSKESCVLLEALPPFMKREVLKHEGPEEHNGATKKFERMLRFKVDSISNKEEGYVTSLYTSEFRFGSPSFSHAIGSIGARFLKYNMGDQTLLSIAPAKEWRCGGSPFLQNEGKKEMKSMVDRKGDLLKIGKNSLTGKEVRDKLWSLLLTFGPLYGPLAVSPLIEYLSRSHQEVKEIFETYEHRYNLVEHEYF